MKLCIFPNDPIKSYEEKGEIKDRYFNPMELFDEVHIISLIDKDIEELKVQSLVGKAKLKIHSVGKINLKNKNKYKKKILDIIKEINPDVIRAFNPRIEGWLAAYCAKNLKIPFFLSLHTQHDQKRKLMKKKNYRKFILLKYFEKVIEPFVLKNADKITIVYKIIKPYVIKHRGCTPELLYNNIDVKKFENGKLIHTLPKPLIISVGNLIKEKNHECIIKAMKNIDANCIIIGKGEMKSELDGLIKSLNLQSKVMIKENVKYSEIQNYYKSARIFALAYDPKLEGLPKPVVEAMASGLPVVVPYPEKEFSDGLEDVAIFANRDPSDFAKKIQSVLHNDRLFNELSLKSIEKSKEFDVSVLEKKEANIYSELISKFNEKNRKKSELGC